MDNYEVCKHVESVNSGIAVYVTRQCKKAHMMKGKLVVSKKECQSCTPVVSAKKEVPKCSECEYCKELRPAGNTRSNFMCKHPDDVYIRKYFEEHKITKMHGFIGFGKRFSDVPPIKTSPAWCPRRKK